MDESHTEDLSSSDMLDVSAPRATDTGVPERSSSDETLNSLHGVDTPGLVSPNEPLHHHSIPQGSQQHVSMVNGTMHHHHYYPQQHSHHHSDSFGGGDPSLPALPVTPLANSSPVMVSQAGPSQRQPMLDNAKPAGGTNQPLAPTAGGTAVDPHPQGNVISSVSFSGAPVPASAGFDSTSVSAQVASVGGGTGPSAAAAAPNTQTHHTQSQTATGSRFRVVKLDTNSEPFRKGRWTCTEYYEKEVHHPATVEPTKGAEVAAEPEASNAGISQGIPAVQPPHTLQPYQQPSQDFTSSQAVQSPPQGLAQTSLNYISPQEVSGGVHMQKPAAPLTFPTATPQAGVTQPPSAIPQQLPYVVDPHQAQPQGSYPAAPQLHAGVMAPGNVRQPDFIQPTAPFQTQVQPPPSHVTAGISVTPVPGVTAQQPVSITQQLPHQGQGAPPTQAVFAGQPQTLPAQPQPHQQPHVQAPSTAAVPGAPAHGTPSMPLTAVLQPLLTPGPTFAQAPGGGSFNKTSQLEDAQKLLLQHQGLLGLPRLGMAAGGEGAADVGGAAGTLAHMGMSAEASAFMAAAAAAGLRTQHAEGEDDR